jgi:hypothetical protein
MIVTELSYGKTLETIFRAKRFLLKMLIRATVIELWSPISIEV